MKVRAKTAFFDGGILRTKGDEFETKAFDPILMDPIEEPKKEAEPKAEKPKKTTSKKKG